MPRWFLNVMRDNTSRTWLVLAWILVLSGWKGLPAYGQLTGSSSTAPLPQTDSSPITDAVPPALPGLQSASTSAVLPLEEAFQLSALFEGDSSLLLSWTIAPGHYLYRDHFEFRSAGQVVPATLPPGTTLEDEYFGETAVYFNALQLRFPLQDLPQTADGEYLIQLLYQGCAQGRYCYPPTLKELRLSLPR